MRIHVPDIRLVSAREHLSQENDALDQLVQADAHHPATLAELYRKARQRGLIHARPQYT